MLTESEFQLLEKYRTNVIAEARSVGFTGELLLQLEVAAAKFAYDLLLKLSAPVTPVSPQPPVTNPTTNGDYPTA